jgi:hypothetical protein
VETPAFFTETLRAFARSVLPVGQVERRSG